MIKSDFPLQPIPIAYYAGDGCRIFNYDLESSEEQKWQVTRMTLEEEGANGRIKDCYTPQRLFLDGKWSSNWDYENEAKYQFPSAAAAWEALKRAREAETQKQQQGERGQLAQRLDQPAEAVSREQWGEFDMRVPAEPQRDADLVLSRAAALLRQPAPVAVPVPVAERPWERKGWRDTEGRCWWFNRAGIPEWQLADGGPYGDFSLPASALPIPESPQGEHAQRSARAAVPDTRDPECVAAWPDCCDGMYDPRCCRFPKECRCEIPSPPPVPQPPQDKEVQP